MRIQLSKGVSIFSCEDWAVFSQQVVNLSPGPPVRLDTTLIIVPAAIMGGQAGTKTSSWLNTETFIAAWNAVRADGRFLSHDYSVKVDPDAVFLPWRLRLHLKEVEPQVFSQARQRGVFFKNCQAELGFYGSLEVISRQGLMQYFLGVGRCKTELDWRGWGEDLFMQTCFELLNVLPFHDYNLLADAYCNNQIPSPCNSGKIAFHPFKSSETYFKCMDEAGGYAEQH